MEFWLIKISLTTEMGGGMFDEKGTDCFLNPLVSHPISLMSLD